MSFSKIRLIRTDRVNPILENTAVKIAGFLFESSSIIFDHFIDLMRVTYNTNKNNYKDKLNIFFSRIIKGKNTAQDILDFRELMFEFFDVCNSNDDIKKMRGLVPEKLFKIIFDERHKNKKCIIEYGALVKVVGRDVIYVPKEPYDNADDSDLRRQTVDAGFWDGTYGEFVEIKLNPDGFRTRDINYLRTLSKVLDDNDIKYTIYLIAFGDKELIARRLKNLGLIDKNIETVNDFKLIGKSEIKDFSIAS